MKKLFLLFVMLMGVLTASAGENVLSLEKGELASLKTGGNVAVVFNFDGAMYDLKEPLATHYSNLAELTTKVPFNFTEGFNGKCKKSKVVDSTDAKYTITIKVDNMDCYYKVVSFVPGHVTKVWGTASIKDNSSGETIAVMQITECAGSRDFTIDDSFGKCFISLGEKLANVFNKGKL